MGWGSFGNGGSGCVEISSIIVSCTFSIGKHALSTFGVTALKKQLDSLGSIREKGFKVAFVITFLKPLACS